MSFLDQFLILPFMRVRQNHALEHATLQVLAEKHPGLRMAGYSDPNGFWLIGQVETEQVRQAVEQALSRLRGGEKSLAIHPHCGTNLVSTGFLAGSFAWLGMLGAGRNFRDRLERWPLVVMLVTLAVFMAQPLGVFMQQQVTTSTPKQEMRIQDIESRQRGEMRTHRIYTSS